MHITVVIYFLYVKNFRKQILQRQWSVSAFGNTYLLRSNRNKIDLHFTKEDASDIILKVECNDGDTMQK